MRNLLVEALGGSRTITAVDYKDIEITKDDSGVIDARGV